MFDIFPSTNCILLTFCNEKITGRLRADWQQEELEDGGEDSNAQEVGPALVSAEEIVHPQDLPSQQPHRNGQLVDGAQAAPQVERSNLRYVHRHQARVQTCRVTRVRQGFKIDGREIVAIHSRPSLRQQENDIMERDVTTTMSMTEQIKS